MLIERGGGGGGGCVLTGKFCVSGMKGQNS